MGTKWTPSAADGLTLLRILLIPLLWGLAAGGFVRALAVGLAVAGTTDVLDGPVARMTGRSSRFGSQLDSVADILLMGSILVWLAWLRPEFFGANALPLLVWAVLGGAAVAATLVRYGRIGDLHLYSAKAAGVAGYLFVCWLFLTGRYDGVLFTVTVGLAIVAAAETLLVALTRERVDGRVGSILLSRR